MGAPCFLYILQRCKVRVTNFSQALSAVMAGGGTEGQAGGPASEVAGTAASMATMPTTPSGPELRTADHRFEDGGGWLVNPIQWDSDKPLQLTPVSASGSATDFSGGAGGTAGPRYGADFAPISAPGGGGYPGGGSPSGGAGFGNESLPSGGSYMLGETVRPDAAISEPPGRNSSCPCAPGAVRRP